MDNMTFYRKSFGGMYKASIKGVYRSSTDIISDECMGDWMNDSFTGLYAVMEKFQNDPFSISLVEAKKVMDDLIEMKYKNLEACQVEHVTDSMKHWCLDNYDVCMGNDDLLARIIPHGMDIISVVYEYFNVLMEDDSCATAQEQIDQITSVSEHIMKVSSEVYGFDAKWGATIDHIPKSDFIEEAQKIAVAEERENAAEKKEYSGPNESKF